MKITRRQLSQIIKEEIDQPSEELDEYAGAAIAATSAMKMLSPIISELQEALGLIDDLFDKYFNHDGEPNEDSMLDDKSRKVLKKFKKRSGPHYSTPGGKAILLNFLMQRAKEQQRVGSKK